MRALALVLVLAWPAAADVLALKDGRFVEGRPIEKTESGFTIKYEHGEVLVPAAMVLDYHKEDASGEYVPQTEAEKKKVAKGYVPWKGRWVKRDSRDRLRKKEAEKRRRRLEQEKERRFWRNHAEVKTRRFIFRHTLPDDVFQEFYDLFETYYKYFTKYWKIRPTSKFGTPVINIYHDRDYFEQVSGAPRGVLGYYVPADRDLHFYYDRQNKDYTIDVMFHEGNHMLTHMIDERMWYPWWISEGMAEYFGASQWDPEKRQMTIGLLQSARLAVLHSQIDDEKWLKLKELLETRGMGGIGYAWAWSFCHYLLSTPRYEKNFKRYFLGLARDKSIRRVDRGSNFRTVAPEDGIPALKRYLKVKSLDALQKEWYGYIQTKLDLKRSEISWGDAGYIMALYGEQAKARFYFKKAIDAGSTDAFVHYGYADLKLDQNMPGIALKYAKKATEYDPLHARAYALMGMALHRQNDESDERVRLLELAHDIDPEDQQIWFMRQTVLQRGTKEDKDEEEDKGEDEDGG